MIISPCISICKTDPVTGYCYGCGRSNDEKKLWKYENTNDEWKKNNLSEIKKVNLGKKAIIYLPEKPIDVITICHC